MNIWTLILGLGGAAIIVYGIALTYLVVAGICEARRQAGERSAPLPPREPPCRTCGEPGRCDGHPSRGLCVRCCDAYARREAAARLPNQFLVQQRQAADAARVQLEALSRSLPLEEFFETRMFEMRVTHDGVQYKPLAPPVKEPPRTRRIAL